MFIIWMGVPEEWMSRQPKLDRRLYFTELDAHALYEWAYNDYLAGNISNKQHAHALHEAWKRLNYVRSIQNN